MRMTPRNVDNVNIMDSNPPKSHRAYHHGDLHNALIEAGLAALEANDAAGLSLRALARELGVSANAVYRHFADKDALLSALAAEGFRRFGQAQAQAQARADTDPIATGLDYVRFAQRHPALFRLMFGSFTRGCDSSDLQTAAMAAFTQLLEGSRPAGHTGPIDEATLLRALVRWSLVHGLSHLLLEGQLSFFGPNGEGAGQQDALARAVLMASGLGPAPAHTTSAPAPAATAQTVGKGKGKPSTKATS